MRNSSVRISGLIGWICPHTHTHAHAHAHYSQNTWAIVFVNLRDDSSLSSLTTTATSTSSSSSFSLSAAAGELRCNIHRHQLITSSTFDLFAFDYSDGICLRELAGQHAAVCQQYRLHLHHFSCRFELALSRRIPKNLHNYRASYQPRCRDDNDVIYPSRAHYAETNDKVRKLCRGEKRDWSLKIINGNLTYQYHKSKDQKQSETANLRRQAAFNLFSLRSASLRTLGLLLNPRRGAFTIANTAMVKFLQKIPESGSRSRLPPKYNRLVPVLCPSIPQNFIQIRLLVFQ